MNKKTLSFLTALIFVAILTLLGIFMLPSSAEKAWLFGLSAQRAVLAFFPFTTSTVNSSLFLSYVALNSIRVVLGEAARLWMFWVPIMAIMAVQYMLPITRRVRWIILGLVILQVITVLLTYQFQDYLMPQLLP